MFRAYYDADGELTTIGVSTDPGNYLQIDQKTFEEITQAPHTWRVVNKRLKKKSTAPHLASNKYQFTNDKGQWIVEKDNLFICVKHATIKPSWFDANKHSWVKYGN